MKNTRTILTIFLGLLFLIGCTVKQQEETPAQVHKINVVKGIGGKYDIEHHHYQYENHGYIFTVSTGGSYISDIHNPNCEKCVHRENEMEKVLIRLAKGERFENPESEPVESKPFNLDPDEEY